MLNLLKSARVKPGARGWAVAFAAVALLASLPPLWRSRFVTGRRAALLVRSAEAHLAAREFDAARADLRAALRLQPADARARQRLAAAEMEAGNWELAFVEYESLTEMHPEDPDGWIALARMMAKGGLLAAPEAALDEAIALAPSRADARVLRAEVRARVGRYYGASLDSRAAGQPAPVDATRAAPAHPARLRAEMRGAGADPLAALAREHWPGRLARARQALDDRMRRQDWASAERIVDSARGAWPGTVFPPFLAGLLQLARGDAAAAERHLSDALAFAPRSPVVATALAKAWSREKGAAYAGERLSQLAERDPGFSFARSMAARAFLDARDPARAQAVLARGLALQPQSPVPYQQLADHHLRLDQPAEALAIAQQGVSRFPTDVPLQLVVARLSADLGRPEEAIRIYDDILSRRPDLDLVEYKLAAALASQADDETVSKRSAQLLEQLGADAPSDPLLLDALGSLRFRAGELDRARELLQAAVQAAPDEPEPHFHLAKLYLREGKTDLARRELDAALEPGRPFPGRLDALRLVREIASPDQSAQGRP